MREITDLNELKTLELQILKQVHTFCEEAGICYSLGAGTLLGAVRHKGFIPWDDDIDIYMPRKDYERFVREFPAWGEKRKLYLARYESKEHRYDNIFAKVCDARTLLLQHRVLKETSELGVFIDIFIMDDYPDGKIARFMCMAEWTVLFRLFRAGRFEASKAKELSSYPWWKRCVIFAFSWVDPAHIYKLIRRRQHHWDKRGGSNYFLWSCGRWFSKEGFRNRLLVPFEDEEFYIAANYDEVLTQRYGDYMTLPPEEKRVPHHVQDIWWRDGEGAE